MSARAALLRRCSGISYMEVMLATLLLAVSLVPALDALQTGIHGAGVNESLVLLRYDLSNKMEWVLAQPFGDLSAEVGKAPLDNVYSDPDPNDPPLSSFRRLVSISTYDPNLPGLLLVRVEAEGAPHALETLTSE